MLEPAHAVDSDEFPIPDPLSFFFEPIDAEELALMAPEHVAAILNAYATAVVHAGLDLLSQPLEDLTA